jgi:hypothetical protein
MLPRKHVAVAAVTITSSVVTESRLVSLILATNEARKK